MLDFIIEEVERLHKCLNNGDARIRMWALDRLQKIHELVFTTEVYVKDLELGRSEEFFTKTLRVMSNDVISDKGEKPYRTIEQRTHFENKLNLESKYVRMSLEIKDRDLPVHFETGDEVQVTVRKTNVST